MIHIRQRDIIEIELPRMERDMYEYPMHNGFVGYVPGIIRPQPFRMKIHYSAHSALHHPMWNELGGEVQIDAFDLRIRGILMSAAPCASIDGQAHWDIEVRMLGKPEQLYTHKEFSMGFDAHPNCRCTSAPIMKEKPVFTKTKVLNRFYVASDKMMSAAEQSTPNTGRQVLEPQYGSKRHTRWAKHDLKMAIDHARDILDGDPSKTEVAIVRIVKVVRRKATPIIVEDVR